MALAAPAIPFGRTFRVHLSGRALLGLVLALLGAGLVFWLYLRGQPHTVEVLVAARDLPPGTVLQADDLLSQSDALPDRLSNLTVPASDRATVLDRPLGLGLTNGAPLMRSQVLDVGTRIPENRRVQSIPVTTDTAAGGLIQPHDEVEILATTNNGHPDQAETRTVLSRVQVYSIGDQRATGPFASADRPGAGAHVTWLNVLVTDEEAHALATARWTGELEVLLLPPQRSADVANAASRPARDVGAP